METKPILFLDFDRTLFDTERYYDWLGEPRRERNQALIDGTLPYPDFSQFLFPDADTFLIALVEKFHVVILSFVKLDYSPKQTLVQSKKITGSGIANKVEDVIVTTKSKGEEAKHYLHQHGLLGKPFFFVDDELSHLANMKALNNESLCIYLDRKEKSSGIPIANGMDEFTPEHVAHDLAGVMQILNK